MTREPAETPILVESAAVADDRGALASPGAILLERPSDPRLCATNASWRVLAVGDPAEVARHASASFARRRSAPDAILTPAFVNAHTHLDLTALGTIAAGEGEFAQWIQGLRAARATRLARDADIADSVALGVALSRAGGVVAAGDIAGMERRAACDALRRSPLMGVSFIEFFGLGAREADAVSRLRALASECAPARDAPESCSLVRLGVQPHAPYTAGGALYTAAADLARRNGVPVSTHVAESLEERRILRSGDGPLQRLLESLDLWDDSTAQSLARGCSPVKRVAPLLTGARPILAHCNDIDDRDIELLASIGAGVVYCPRSSAYLGHTQRLGPHRYRDLLQAGAPVALGTDSVASLPAFERPLVSGARLSPLDDARWLWRAGERDAALLLGMITTTPAAMLGLDPALFRFEPGRDIAGVAATRVGPPARAASAGDALERLFACDAAPSLLAPTDGSSATL